MPGAVFLRDERVALRTVEPEDHEFLQRNENDPRVRRWFPAARPLTAEEIRERYGAGSDDGETLLVCDGAGEDAERLGAVALYDYRPDSGRAEVGAWLAPGAQGQGYATAALTLLVEHAFADLNCHRVEAGAMATNGRSRAMLERLGFVEEGRRRDHYFAGGEYVDRVVYGLLEDEWDEDPGE